MASGTMRLALPVWAGAVLLLAPLSPLAAAPPDRPAPAVLVDADWVAEHAADPSVRILELGQTHAQYLEGHLPGAVFVDWVKDITDPAAIDRYNKPDRRRFEALLGRLGVGRETVVVLADSVQNRLSVRMLWLLRCYGHRQARVLDGGRDAWLRSGRGFTTKRPVVEPTDYVVQSEPAGLEAGRRFIEQNLADPHVLLIDGRPAGQYTGELPGKVFHTGVEHARRGHIPGAASIPWGANLKADGTFKSPEALRDLYASVGATGGRTVVAYCNEGLHAAMPWFVLTELLGHDDTRVYDDSMAEWANAEDTPMDVD